MGTSAGPCADATAWVLSSYVSLRCGREAYATRFHFAMSQESLPNLRLLMGKQVLMSRNTWCNMLKQGVKLGHCSKALFSAAAPTQCHIEVSTTQMVMR